MGIHDREYYRNDPRGWGADGLRAVAVLIAVTVAAFVVQLFSSPGRGLPDQLLKNGAFVFPLILEGELWRLVTSFFVHDPRTLFGVILGMFVLYGFGTELEELYGTRRFAWFYLLAGTLVSGGKVLLGLAGVDPQVWTAGAGGPVFAVLVLFALHYPGRPISFILYTLPAWLVVVGLMALYALAFVLTNGSRMEVAVPFLAAAFAAAFFKLADTRYAERPRDHGRSARARPKRSLRVTDAPAGSDEEEDSTPPVPTRGRPGRPDEYLEAKLDAVLEKMAKSGRDSLTAEENDVLLRASEVYRQKRK